MVKCYDYIESQKVRWKETRKRCNLRDLFYSLKFFVVFDELDSFQNNTEENDSMLITVMYLTFLIN